MNCSDARMPSTNDTTSSGCPTNAAPTTSAIAGWSASHSVRMTTPSTTCGDASRDGRQLAGRFGRRVVRRPSAGRPTLAVVSDAVERASALRAYAEETASCTRCPLAEGRTQVVFGVGNPDADLMFVGEAPGFHEDQQGIPFVGQAGKLL